MRRAWFSVPLLAVLCLWLAPTAARAAGPGTLKYDESTFQVVETAGVAIVLVQRSGGEDGAVSIHYATSDGSAMAGSDYTATSGTLSWADGDETTKTFDIPILDDTVAEGDETILLTLSDVTGGAAIDSVKGTAMVVILANDGGGGDGNGGDDNGPGGTVKFDERDYYVVEASGLAVITVERSQGETGAASVDYATGGGTATAGSDYTATSGTLNWGSGDEETKTFTIPIKNDAIMEGGETVELTLSNASGATLDPDRSTAVLHIVDDATDDESEDGGSSPGVFKFDERGFQALEGSGTAVVRVERSQGEQGAVSVHYATSDGSATAGSDYTATSGTLSWGNGDGSAKTFTVPILDDSASEGNETVALTLSDPTGGATLDPERKTSTLTVLDDDGDTSACVDDDDTLCLEGGRFKVEVSWRTLQGTTGHGHMVPETDNSGLVWFFSADNLEILVKVLNACQGFNRYWVFFAATTNVDFTLEVTDTATGVVKEYKNPLGQAAEPIQDTFTFETCP